VTNRDLLYLRHILDALEKVENYACVGRETFLRETHWQDAIIRQLEIVGEAAKRLSPELRLRYHDVPWRRMAGLRDVLIHNYMGVDLDTLWALTQREVPDLKQSIQPILETEERQQQPGSSHTE